MKTKHILFKILLLLLIIQTSNSWAQLPKETEGKKEERMAWWKHDRFGMFIHYLKRLRGKKRSEWLGGNMIASECLSIGGYMPCRLDMSGQKSMSV